MRSHRYSRSRKLQGSASHSLPIESSPLLRATATPVKRGEAEARHVLLAQAVLTQTLQARRLPPARGLRSGTASALPLPASAPRCEAEGNAKPSLRGECNPAATSPPARRAGELPAPGASPAHRHGGRPDGRPVQVSVTAGISTAFASAAYKCQDTESASLTTNNVNAQMKSSFPHSIKLRCFFTLCAVQMFFKAEVQLPAMWGSPVS